jgi:hypothetical protein
LPLICAPILAQPEWRSYGASIAGWANGWWVIGDYFFNQEMFGRVLPEVVHVDFGGDRLAVGKHKMTVNEGLRNS